jgi:outer membrane receptor protein involved in Fe transport
MSLGDAKNFEELDEFGVVTPSPWPSTLSYRYQNPYWVVNYDKTHEDRSQIFGFLSAKFEITDWLSVTGRANLDKSFIFRDQKSNQGTVSWATRPGGYYSDNKSISTIQWYDLIFKGNNDIGELFNINYNVGAIYQDQLFTQDGTVSDGLNVTNKFTHNFGTNPVVSSSGSQIQTQSVFGLVNLSYRNAIYVEASVRNDWDSRLPAPHAYQYYSVGGSGILSELIELPSFLSLLKVNLSYAEVGNGGQFGLLTNTYQYSSGVANGYISRTPTFSIPGLKPEIIKSKEAGFEAKFLNNRYSFNFTYYKSNSINQLLTISLPEATGYIQRYINAGNIQNSGVELILSASPVIQRDFDWLINFNIAFNRNKVIELADGLDVVYQGSFVDWGGRPQIAVGGSYGDLVATKWARDENGNFLVSDAGTPITSGAVGEQPSVIGNFNPKATLGLTNTFTYKNFSLRLLVDGRMGGVVISGTEQNLAFSGVTESTLPYREGGWVLGGVNTNGEPVDAAITAQNFWQTASQKRSGTGEFFTYDATNIRLREVSLGYSVPFAPSNFIKSVRLSLVGRNLLWL